MISHTRQSILIELGKIASIPGCMLKMMLEERKKRKEKKYRLKMAILSGSIRRVK